MSQLPRRFAQLFLLLSVCLCRPLRAELGILMPVYTEDPAQFAAAYAVLGKVKLIAIINPDDGPGAAPVADLVTFVNTVKAGGGQVVGYINSLYANLNVSVGGAADQQMDRYASFYGVHGFFVDEVADANPAYYTSFKNLDTSRYLILNPGTDVPASYNALAKIIVTYENPLGGDQSLPFLQFPNSLATSSTASGAIIYDCSTEAIMRSCVDRAVNQGYDWLFITNDINPNPFDGIASYWQPEINYIAGKNPAPPLSSAAFKMSKPIAAVGGGWTLSFPAVVGRTYEIQVSTNLGAWTTATLKANSAVARVTASTTTITMTVNAPAGSKKTFWRAADVTP